MIKILKNFIIYIYINDKFYELHKKLDSSDDIFESFKLKSKIELLSELIYKTF